MIFPMRNGPHDFLNISDGLRKRWIFMQATTCNNKRFRSKFAIIFSWEDLEHLLI